MPGPAGLGHRLHLLLPADVAGVDADGVDALLRAAQSIAVVEMDVRHHGDVDALLDGAYRVGGRLVGNGHPDDLASGLLQLEDLGHSGLHIVGLGIAHGLNGHRGAAAHGDSAHQDLSCHALTLSNQFGDIRKGHHQHQAHQQQKASGVDIVFIFIRDLSLEQDQGDGVQQQKEDLAAVQRRQWQ